MRLPLSRSKSTQVPRGDDAVQAARTRARRRLIGAVVLLVAGIIGFPMLFDTAPRPVPADTPIVAPPRESGVPPSAAPHALPPADAGNEVATASPREGAKAPEDRAGNAPTPQAPAAKAPEPPAKPPAMAPAARSARPPPAPGKAAPAQAVAAAKPPQPAPRADRQAAAAPASSQRYVVQVGAYTDLATMRETRAHVEKLGLKTFTQVVEGGRKKPTRLRVGPFDNREEAAAAAAKLKAAGLPGAILTL
jgi:DedD protein